MKAFAFGSLEPLDVEAVPPTPIYCIGGAPVTPPIVEESVVKLEVDPWYDRGRDENFDQVASSSSRAGGDPERSQKKEFQRDLSKDDVPSVAPSTSNSQRRISYWGRP